MRKFQITVASISFFSRSWIAKCSWQRILLTRFGLRVNMTDLLEDNHISLFSIYVLSKVKVTDPTKSCFWYKWNTYSKALLRKISCLKTFDPDNKRCCFPFLLHERSIGHVLWFWTSYNMKFDWNLQRNIFKIRRVEWNYAILCQQFRYF